MQAKLTNQIRRKLGNDSEQKAYDYFILNGFKLIEKNARWRGGELDLIMMSPQFDLVFIEVRSTSSHSAWLRHSIGNHKKKCLSKTIHRYLQMMNKEELKPRGVRFDVVWVCGDQIEHWPNVQL